MWRKGGARRKTREEAVLMVQVEGDEGLDWPEVVGIERTQEVALDLAIMGGAITLWFHKNGLCNQKMQVRAQLCPLQPCEPWIYYLTILSLGFLICTLEIIAVATMKLGGLWELLSVAPETWWMLRMNGGGSQGQLPVCSECQGGWRCHPWWRTQDGAVWGKARPPRYRGSNIKALALLTRVMDLLMSLITSFVCVFWCPALCSGT